MKLNKCEYPKSCLLKIFQNFVLLVLDNKSLQDVVGLQVILMPLKKSLEGLKKLFEIFVSSFFVKIWPDLHYFEDFDDFLLTQDSKAVHDGDLRGRFEDLRNYLQVKASFVFSFSVSSQISSGPLLLPVNLLESLQFSVNLHFSVAVEEFWDHI